MTRNVMLAGNWKMNKNWAEAVVLSQAISNQSRGSWESIDIVLCPPACDLKAVYSVLEFDRSSIKLGAQNVHWEPSGAFTGEISVGMLSEIGVEYCIVGHSERRTLFAETDEMVNRKVHAVLNGGLIPIVCVGESLGLRDAGTYLDYIRAQVSAALAGLDAEQVARLAIAYEPIWAIGTGRTATPEAAQEVCAAIRAQVALDFTAEAADAMRVLYGGSMKPENARGLLAEADIDGGLIGGASLKAESFVQLIEECLS